MFFEDFILRQIAFAAVVAAKVLGLSNKGRYTEAYEMIDQAIEEMFGLKADMIKQMNDMGLVSLLTASRFVDTDKLFALANLFIVEGDVLASQKRNKESQQSYQRALNLFNIFSSHYPDSLDTDIEVWIGELQQKIMSAGK
jgi:predicted negative regulator of RcsB-dependent stress response